MIATTWGTVYRGDDANEYGDETDLDAPVDGLERIPLAITEQSRTVMDTESGEPRVIRYAIGRTYAKYPVQADDRIRDGRTKRLYVVRSTSGGGFTFYGQQDITLELRAV